MYTQVFRHSYYVPEWVGSVHSNEVTAVNHWQSRKIVAGEVHRTFQVKNTKGNIRQTYLLAKKNLIIR